MILVQAQTEGERRLAAGTARGESVSLRRLKKADRAIRSEFLRGLVEGRATLDDAPVELTSRGVRVTYAFFPEGLDLEDVDFPASLHLEDSRFEGPVSFRGARFRYLSLDGAFFSHHVDVEYARIKGEFRALDTTFNQGLRLQCAKVDGCVSLDGAKLREGQGPHSDGRHALDARLAVIGGDLSCGESGLHKRFSAMGEVDMGNATIAGCWFCTGASFTNPRGEAISANDIRVAGSVFFRTDEKDAPFVAKGEVSMTGAKIEGQWSCRGGRFENPGGDAICADGAIVGDNVGFAASDEGGPFTAKGEVRLMDARIGGQWVCTGGRFLNPGGTAIDGSGVDVRRDLFLQTKEETCPFTAEGEVSLLGATIGGDFGCVGGVFENPAGTAIHCDRISVVGDVSFLTVEAGSPFRACGGVRLVGARLEGTLDCAGGRFESADGSAISADRADIRGSVYLRTEAADSPFVANGEVRFLGARIGGQWDCSGGRFENPGGDAISADHAEVRDNLCFATDDRDAPFKAEGRIGLPGATIGGNVYCTGGSFDNGGQDALDLDRSSVRGDLFMTTEDPDVPFAADGEVSMRGAKIGGDWFCNGGRFKCNNGAPIKAGGVVVGGDVVFVPSAENVAAVVEGDVRLGGARIAGDLYWRDVEGSPGLDLSYAALRWFCIIPPDAPDEAARWELSGLVYAMPPDLDFCDVGGLLRLLKQCDGGRFYPQPYRQLWRSLRTMGHYAEAKIVREEWMKDEAASLKGDVADLGDGPAGGL